MMRKIWSDAQIIDGFNGDESARDAAILALYFERQMPAKVKKVLLGLGCAANLVQDFFQDTIIEVDKQIPAGKFRGDSSLETWIVAIAKNKFLAARQMEKRRENLLDQSDLNWNEEPLIDPELELLVAEYNQATRNVVEKMDNDCNFILTAFYFEHRSIREINANQIGETENKTKSALFECRQKMRKIIEASPVLCQLLKPKSNVEN
jgi:RNA polymerase sigma factor (sigma-70 family)